MSQQPWGLSVQGHGPKSESSLGQHSPQLTLCAQDTPTPSGDYVPRTTLAPFRFQMWTSPGLWGSGVRSVNDWGPPFRPPAKGMPPLRAQPFRPLQGAAREGTSDWAQPRLLPTTPSTSRRLNRLQASKARPASTKRCHPPAPPRPVWQLSVPTPPDPRDWDQGVRLSMAA